jgi:hypothetical protein
VFGSYARGYKGQAVDADIYLTQASYNASPAGAEKSRSWEAGFKGRFLDRRAELNITYYDTLFTGYQTSSAGLDGSGAPVLRSAGKLYTSGVEGDVTFRPTRALTLSGNFLFADNAFGDLYVDAVTNVKGGRPLNAPDTKYGLSGSYDAVVSEWPVSFNANYTWTSETLFSNLADAAKPSSVWMRPSYGIANASVTVRDPSDRYRVTLFVKNLGDKHYVDGLRRISGSVGGAGAVAQSLPRDFDRYIGADLRGGVLMTATPTEGRGAADRAGRWADIFRIGALGGLLGRKRHLGLRGDRLGGRAASVAALGHPGQRGGPGVRQADPGRPGPGGLRCRDGDPFRLRHGLGRAVRVDLAVLPPARRGSHARGAVLCRRRLDRDASGDHGRGRRPSRLRRPRRGHRRVHVALLLHRADGVVRERGSKAPLRSWRTG